MKNILLLLLAVLTIENISYAGFPVTEKKITIFIDSKCDNIILKDGSEISAKIVEITADLIKYRKCSNLDGPLFSINTNDVLLIRYLDGTKEVFKVNNNSDTGDSNGYGYYGTASLVLGILGLIVLPIVFSTLATIFGVMGKKRKQKLSKAGLVLGIIGLAFMVVAILLLVSILMY